MQTDKPATRTIESSGSYALPNQLVEQLASGHPRSALAAESRQRFIHTEDDFVGALSSGAKAYLSQLQAPAASDRAVALPPVPPPLAEELFVFADYALLPELQGPARDAILQEITVPRALDLLYACCTVHRQRTPGYVALKQQLQTYLVHNIASLRWSCDYQRMSRQKKSTIDRALRREMDYTLDNGSLRELAVLQRAILNHIEKGCLHPRVLQRRQVMAWLCKYASVETWHALAEQGHDIVHLVLRRRAVAFLHAAQAGRCDLVRAMWEVVPAAKRDVLWNAHGHCALRFALLRGDTATLAHIFCELSAIQRQEVAANLAVWEAAAQSRRGTMVHYVRQWLPYDGAGHQEALKHLVAQGYHEAVAELLQPHPSQREEAAGHLLPAECFGAFQTACASGEAEALGSLVAHAERHPELLHMLLENGLTAACAEKMSEARRQGVIARVEEAALRHHFDPFASLGHQALAQACGQGHVEILQRALRSMDAAARRSLLLRETDVSGRQMALLTAACATGQHAVVEALFDWAKPRYEAATLVLQHNGAALLAASESGDAALLERLLALATTSQAWDAWLTDDNIAEVLRRAVASNAPDALQAWLAVIPQERHIELLRGGQLIAEALYSDAEVTLGALFERAAALDAPAAAGASADGLTAAFLQEAIPDRTDPASPLAFAMRHGFTQAVDAVLGRMASPKARKQVYQDCFGALCKTDVAYFRQVWDTFTDQERATLLTPRILAELPMHVSPDVAVYLLRSHMQAFMHALQALPVPELSLQQCNAALELLRAAPALARARIAQAWGETLLRTAIDCECVELWTILVAHLRQDVVLRVLAEDDCKVFLAARGALYAPMLSFVMLSGAWLRDCGHHGVLGALATLDLVRTDNVTLLREYLARYPQARRHPFVRAALRPHDATWSLSKPRITAFLAATEPLARPPGNVT